jgi:hypothetical protein
MVVWPSMRRHLAGSLEEILVSAMEASYGPICQVLLVVTE